MSEQQLITIEAPHGRREWVEFLQERSLPIRNSVLLRLQKQLHDPNSSLNQITQIVRGDPALCLAVVQTAGLRHQAINSRVTSLDHAINSLGMDQLSALRYQLTPHKLNPNSVGQKMYFRSMATSYHAMTQCHQWLSQRKSPFLEESSLASLFYGVGYWFLWQHATRHMCEIQIRIREQHREPQLAESDVLGCAVDQISQGLLEAWGISELAQQGLEHDEVSNRQFMRQLHRRVLDENSLNKDARREVSLLIQEKFFPVKLSNWLAQSVDFGWQRPASLQVIDVVNDYLKGEISATQTQLHINCVNASRQYHVRGTLALAAELLMLPSATTINYRLEQTEADNLELQPPLTVNQPTANTGNAAFDQPLDHKPIDQALMDQTLTKLQQPAEYFKLPKDILRELLLTLNHSLKFERAALFLINPRHRQLKTAFSFGFPDQHPISRFNFDYHIASLLKQLSEQPKVVCIRPEHRQKVLRFLPENYQQWAPINGFMLLSLFNGAQPIAIIHVDNGMGGDSISEAQQKAATKLAHLTTKALTLLQNTSAEMK
ncbi:HDOD domain-containing protein [Neptuniibacter sp. CAU 1671]|uniref:HDOD domain-containing protein n=1 Tax=Neptuniibacter sp. CAU 1671 TaxID=3032593 RepID=UPI0023DA6B09|nr:HDOD domain-containing protein [Neptuniibacter sp. CAU 1671]MDF2181902.1 HDOD domain-containing protein [Neptuniibacter sp. CAU 1671]